MRNFMTSGLGLILVLTTGTVVAQIPNPDFVLSLPDVAVPPLTTASVDVNLNNSIGGPVAGFSLGVCHDPSEVSLTGGEPGFVLQTINGGDPADFLTVDLYPDGLTMGTVISFTGANSLPGGSHDVLSIDYFLDGPLLTVADISFCDTAGVPPVGTIIVVPAGIAVTPVQIDGSITYADDIPLFSFTVPSLSVGFAAGTGEASFTVGATIAESADSPGVPNDTHGFSMGLAHDPEFLEGTGVTPTSVLEALNGGDGPDFFGASLLVNGVTLGVVYAFIDDTQVLLFDTPQEVIEIAYSTNAENLENVMVPVMTDLSWTNGLGDPPIANLVAYALTGDTTPAAQVDGTVTLIPGGTFMVRGDCTADGGYTLGDPLALLGFVFLQVGPVACQDACDADDDGELGLLDGIYLLNDLFLNGPDPLAPYPSCGVDPTADSLTCDTFPAC